MFYIELIIIFAIAVLISVPLGKYMYKIFSFEKVPGEKFFNSIENFIYRLCGIKEDRDMSWKKYAASFITINVVMIIFAFIILRFQKYLPYNPTNAGNMDTFLAFNTAVSFVTNTNLQHYAGETGISMLSENIVIIFLMFTSVASAIATAAAIMRGISKKSETVGNFYKDFTRIITRVLLPLSVIVTLLLVSQGVPETLGKVLNINTFGGGKQTIITGPVAALESIKHIGNNGGGFYAANSAHPFENPTPFTNLIEMICMMIIPCSLIYCFGLMVKNRKHAVVIFTSLLVLFVILSAGGYIAEKTGGIKYADLNINTALGNMEGKETRFGASDSSLFSSITTAFTTGSVNSMHDSYTPLGGAVPMLFMMLNTIFGGAGSGIENIILYAILTVFITGLMVGRTPEYLGNKIETREVKLAALAILIHPLLILFSSALTIGLKFAASAMTNPSFHGLSQMFYEFTSAAANNGSEFAGFLANTPYFNTITGIIMFLGRYITIILLLAIAGSLAGKTKTEPSPGTFRTDNPLFGVLLVATIIIIGALTFFPAIILGPIAEYLSLV